MAIGKLVEKLHQPQVAEDDDEDNYVLTATSMAAGISNKTAGLSLAIDEIDEQDKRASQLAKISSRLGMEEDDVRDWLAEHCPNLYEKVNECGSTAMKAGVGLAGTLAGAAFIPIPLVGALPFGGLASSLIAGGVGGFGSTAAYGYFTGDSSNGSEELKEARNLIKSGVRAADAFRSIEQRLSGHGLPDEARAAPDFSLSA